MKNRRNRAQRLRSSVEALPPHTRAAMLKGLAGNEIIVGAYTDREGGICPMLAAHRNGGRTSFASFARAWDAFTGARKPRRATRREVRALRTYLEMSLLGDHSTGGSLGQVVDSVQAGRRAESERAAADTGTRLTIEDLLLPPETGRRGGEETVAATENRRRAPLRAG